MAPDDNQKSAKVTLAEQIRDARALQQRIDALAREYLAPRIALFSESINRVDGLIWAASYLPDQSVAQDVLRAAVVLNHAYFEDFLDTMSGSKKRFNLNHVAQIEKLLRNMHFDPELWWGVDKKQRPTLAKMIERRHLIVHNADRTTARTLGSHKPQVIDAPEVSSWVRATRAFVARLLQLTGLDHVHRHLRSGGGDPT
jgi:hypothetical protein